jgi:hypothetical protein
MKIERLKTAEDLVLSLLAAQPRLVLAVAWNYITNREGFTRGEIGHVIDQELKKE